MRTTKSLLLNLLAVLAIIGMPFQINAQEYIAYYDDPGNPGNQGGSTIIPTGQGTFFTAGYNEDNVVLMEIQPDGVILTQNEFQVSTGPDRVSDLTIVDHQLLVAGWSINASGNRFAFAFSVDFSLSAINWTHFEQTSNTAYHTINQSPADPFELLLTGQTNVGVGSHAWVRTLDLFSGNQGSLNSDYSVVTSSNAIDFKSVIIDNGEAFFAGRTEIMGTLRSSRPTITTLDLSNGNINQSFYYIHDSATHARLYGTDIILDQSRQNIVYLINGDPNGTSSQFDMIVGLVDRNTLNWNNSMHYVARSGEPLRGRQIRRVDHEYIVYGMVGDQASTDNFFLMKLDENLNVRWSVKIDNPGTAANTNGFSDKLLIDGHFAYIIGESDYYNGTTDQIIATVDINEPGECYTNLDVELLDDIPRFMAPPNWTIINPNLNTTAPAITQVQDTLELDYSCGLCLPPSCQAGAWPVSSNAQPGAGIGGTAIVSNSIEAKDGHIYVAGEFIGNVTLGTVTINNPGPNYRMYVASYDECGTVDWVSTAAGSAGPNAGVTGLVVNDEGEVFVSGYFTTGTMIFGGTTIDAQETNETAGWSSYVVKYSATGGVLWVDFFRKDNSLITPCMSFMENLAGLAIDNSGDVYMGGTVWGDIHLPGLGLNSFQSCGNPWTGYVFKLNGGTGAIMWGEQYGPYHNGRDLAYSSTGMVYLTGYANPPGSSHAPFLTEFHATFGFPTSNSIVGSSSSNAYATAVETRGGSVYVGGNSVGNVSLGGCTVSGGSHGWLVELDASMNCVNSKSIAGAGNQTVSDIRSAANSIFVMGNTNGSNTSFGNGVNASLTPGSSQDVFLAEYTPNLTANWGNSYGGSGATAHGLAMAYGECEGVYAHGYFMNGTNNIGPGILPTPTGVADIFIARIDGNGTSFKRAENQGWIDKGELEDEIKLYPNPNSGSFTISGLAGITEVTIIDPMGRIVFQEGITNKNAIDLDLQDLPGGLYWVLMKDEDGQVEKSKTVIQR